MVNVLNSWFRFCLGYCCSSQDSDYTQRATSSLFMRSGGCSKEFFLNLLIVRQVQNVSHLKSSITRSQWSSGKKTVPSVNDGERRWTLVGDAGWLLPAPDSIVPAFPRACTLQKFGHDYDGAFSKNRFSAQAAAQTPDVALFRLLQSREFSLPVFISTLGPLLFDTLSTETAFV